MTGTAERKLAARTQDFLELHQRIRCIEDQQAHDALLEELQHPSRPYIVSFVNAHAANLGWNTPGMVQSLLRSDLLLRDGIGVKLGLKAFGRPHGLNMNGTDFIPRIARAYKGRRAALFGTQSPWLDTARQRLEADGLVVVACHDGFSPPETYLELAAETKPELILLAMGMPKQEDIAVRLRERLSHPCLIVNGGAILDFLGGKVTRAPELMRNTGLEWMYRLYLEPKRLARRYLLGIPVFFSHVAVTRLVGRQVSESGEQSR
ncbi:WecB/TagA/CpsF family glycosyltransferase [Hyalangium gracile]|uniref:WecB/TagA/CpsF family glycosyltransferase n=1 Tax=Hyalangium gracile TaxID=394092 RepID=UPI001CCF144A|nr:WecB/TagA/CpsF family glycosyltransferase [Hyalangium gracile]